jgi:hypothetical protein
LLLKLQWVRRRTSCQQQGLRAVNTAAGTRALQQQQQQAPLTQTRQYKTALRPLQLPLLLLLMMMMVRMLGLRSLRPNILNKQKQQQQ